jgi:hypothetical protein
MAIEFRITVEHVGELQTELELLLKGLVKPLAAATKPVQVFVSHEPEPKVETPTAPVEQTKPEPVAAKKGGKKSNGNGEEKHSEPMQKARGLMAQYSAIYGIDPAVNDLQEVLRRRFITKKYKKLAEVPEADLPRLVTDLQNMLDKNPFGRTAMQAQVRA